MIKTIEWTDEGVRMLDQRLLPTEEKYLTFRSCEEVAEAIKQMVVRGRCQCESEAGHFVRKTRICHF